MKTTSKIYRFALSAVFSLSALISSGQQNNSLYLLDRVPQSVQLNPALQPLCTFYFGIPAVSGIEINAGNNFLGVGDIFIQNREAGRLVYPLYDRETTLSTIAKLGKNNLVSANSQIDLLSFGFRINESYLSFLISDKLNVNTGIPKDLVNFLYEGIDVGKSFTFENFGLNATYYREYSAGYSHRINRLSFGIRGKLLFGKANISARQTSISLHVPEWQTLEVSSSIRWNSSVPGMELYTDANGRPDSMRFREFEHTSDLINDIILLKKNKGFAIDFGFQYLLSEKVAVSASITDLGFINWKANVNSIAGGGDYRFHGININADSLNAAEELLDTLKNVYDITTLTHPYSTFLSPKLYAALSYSPNKYVKAGLLFRSEYVLKTFRQQVSGVLTLYPFQAFGATVSYTVANKLYDNLGIGFVFRGGPLQLYFMSERIPVYWNKVKNHDIPYLPVHAREANFRMGMNLVFGNNITRKLKKDQPFLE